MSAVASVDIGSMIRKVMSETGERACIAGTASSVKSIANWYNMGETPEEIQRDYPHLTLAQVYAALAYYHANREEIDRAIELDAAAGRELSSQGGKA